MHLLLPPHPHCPPIHLPADRGGHGTNVPPPPACSFFSATAEACAAPSTRNDAGRNNVVFDDAIGWCPTPAGDIIFLEATDRNPAPVAFGLAYRALFINPPPGSSSLRLLLVPCLTRPGVGAAAGKLLLPAPSILAYEYYAVQLLCSQQSSRSARSYERTVPRYDGQAQPDKKG